MATKASRSAARIMMAPAVILLLGWMLVPLIMTLWFSFRNYLPLRGGDLGFAGFDNYVRFVSSSAFWPAVMATLIIVGRHAYYHRGFGRFACPVAGPADVGSGDCPHPCDCAVLCYADRVGPGLEEHVPGLGQRAFCAYLHGFLGQRLLNG